MTVLLDDVLLRRPEPKDVEELYRYRNDWEAIRLLGGFSTGYAMQDLRDWIEAHRKQNNEVLWVIAERAEDRCLGHVGLYRIDYRIRSAEFAIFIGDGNQRGRGLGERVSRAVIDYGFRQLNLHRIELTVLANNTPAIKLYEKLGFKHEGTQRDAQFRDGHYLDVMIMGLLDREW